MKVLLVVYDNESYIHHFPMGIAYIATALRDAGHEVNIYSQDLYHYPDEHLTEYLNNHSYDAVGLGIVAGYYPYRKLLKISEAINKTDKKPFYILGGHGPAPEPEYFLRKSGADAVVVGEGDITIVNLMNVVKNRTSLSSVKGIAYLENGQLVQTPRQELITDIDTIPFPAYDLFPMDYYALWRIGNVTKPTDRLAILLSGRGCPFHCNFCYRMDEGFRVRSPQNIIKEIQHLRDTYNLNFFFFQDELLMTSVERTVKLCEALEPLNIRWACNGRLNFAKPEVLKLMKESGCVFINYGIESLDDDALKAMRKNLTVKQITKGIEATLSVGIHPGFNIIFGNIGETKDVLWKDVDFLLKYDDQGQVRTIRPVTPYPGSDLYAYAIKTGKLKGVADFYENKHVNQDLLSVNFTDMTDEEFYVELHRANIELMGNYYRKQMMDVSITCWDLYFNLNADFRGFRQS